MVVLRHAELLTTLALASRSIAGSLKTPAPQMGWNSYNNHACEIDEDIILANAKGLVESGLFELGYEYVTPDCGWYNGRRDETGALEWNTTRFPSGGKGLGDKLHDIGVKFGVYSGGGYWQCLGGNQYQGSLGEPRDKSANVTFG
jgi:alpha-galactosidase